MTTTHIDPALACALAHERRRHAALPPLDDLLPLTEDEALPLDWSAPTVAGARWSGIPALAENIAGMVIITIGVGWLSGYAIALALLNRSVLSALGIAP